MYEYQQNQIWTWDSRDAERGVGVVADKRHNSGKPWEKGQMQFFVQTEKQGREVYVLPRTQMLNPITG